MNLHIIYDFVQPYISTVVGPNSAGASSQTKRVMDRKKWRKQEQRKTSNTNILQAINFISTEQHHFQIFFTKCLSKSAEWRTLLASKLELFLPRASPSSHISSLPAQSELYCRGLTYGDLSKVKTRPHSSGGPLLQNIYLTANSPVLRDLEVSTNFCSLDAILKRHFTYFGRVGMGKAGIKIL